MKRGKNPGNYIVTQDEAEPFREGDFLCFYRDKKKFACGNVIQTNSTAAAVKITMKKRDMGGSGA